MGINLLYLLILFIGPMAFGWICSRISKRSIGIVLSISVPWTVFLGLNLYSEYHGADRELMQGIWKFFQATLGTLVVFLALVGYCIALILKRSSSNSSLNPDLQQNDAASRHRL